MSLNVDGFGGLDKAAYEFMKTLAGEVVDAARTEHADKGHAGPVGTCPSLVCSHRVKLLRWATHLEQCRENPDYQGRDKTYAEITTGGKR